MVLGLAIVLIGVMVVWFSVGLVGATVAAAIARDMCTTPIWEKNCD